VDPGSSALLVRAGYAISARRRAGARPAGAERPLCLTRTIFERQPLGNDLRRVRRAVRIARASNLAMFRFAPLVTSANDERKSPRERAFSTAPFLRGPGFWFRPRVEENLQPSIVASDDSERPAYSSIGTK
jgi:hypothetical protein